MLRHAIRRLLRSPGYAIPVVASLALGVGANTAVFSELDHALRRPLPFAVADHLVVVGLVVSRGPAGSGVSGAPDWTIYPGDLDAWKARSRSLQSLAVYTPYSEVVAGHAQAEYVAGAMATASLPRVLGTHPARGRWFTPEETHARVVVLSHSLWQRQFGGDANVLGQALRIQGLPWTVIGVMPPDLSLPVGAEYWLPLPPGFPGGQVVGRLKPGVTREHVAAELQTLAPSVANNARYGVSERIVVTSLHDYLFGNAAPPLALLFGASALLLLITCANVASLALARALERRRELAVRMALGAGRVRLTATIVVENVLLALVGAAIGGIVAFWGVRVVTALAPEEIARLGPPRLDGLTVIFAVGAAVVSALLVSAAPVLSATDASVHRLLGHMGSPGALDRVRPTMRRALVAAQIALAMVLIAGAGLLLRSISRLTRPDHLGFSPQGVVIASVAGFGAEYQESRQEFVRALVARVRVVPGVQAVALGPPPLVAGKGEVGYREGFSMMFVYHDSLTPGAPSTMVWVKDVDPEYLQVFNIHLRDGRNFRTSDNATAPRVAILNASAARLFFHGREPIGRDLSVPALTRELVGSGPVIPGSSRFRTVPPPRVVGVVDDMLQRDLTLGANPEVLLPLAQHPGSILGASLAVRTSGDPAALIGAIRRAMREVDSNLAPTRLEPMQRVVDASLRPHAFLMRLLVAFALVGAALAIIGIYAVIAYLVTRRTAELGIRMALGAQRTDVVALIMREGAVVTASGVLAGTVAALGAARLLRAFLFEVSAHDTATFVLAPIGFALVALVAAFFPARRAAGIAPASALRE